MYEYGRAAAAFARGLRLDPSNKDLAARKATAEAHSKYEDACLQSQLGTHRRNLVLKLRAVRSNFLQIYAFGDGQSFYLEHSVGETHNMSFVWASARLLVSSGKCQNILSCLFWCASAASCLGCQFCIERSYSADTLDHSRHALGRLDQG